MAAAEDTNSERLTSLPESLVTTEGNNIYFCWNITMFNYIYIYILYTICIVYNTVILVCWTVASKPYTTPFSHKEGLAYNFGMGDYNIIYMILEWILFGSKWKSCILFKYKLGIEKALVMKCMTLYMLLYCRFSYLSKCWYIFHSWGWHNFGSPCRGFPSSNNLLSNNWWWWWFTSGITSKYWPASRIQFKSRPVSWKNLWWTTEGKFWIIIDWPAWT